eukprot:TRINITY_DN10668_c0_g1_i1.p1 TRINITY_DN10668_c0_g1~~TRINITY_DN10668_c0_g1_i1.p1  ORF type:complete len:274 (-),score=42.33 TRINITY_DN10668_c0_g1_i1:13-834(-)
MSATTSENAWGSVATVFKPSSHRGLMAIPVEYGAATVAAVKFPEAPTSKKKYIDIACGGGCVVMHAAEILDPNLYEIHATDFSEGMIKQAKENFKDKNLDHIQLQVMNAEDLKFEDNSFDYLTCQFAVNFFPNVKKGFEEMHRVLRPGGVCVVSTWKHSDILGLMLKGYQLTTGTEYDQKKNPLMPTDFSSLSISEEFARNVGFKNVTGEVVERTIEIPSGSIWPIMKNNPVSIIVKANMTEDEKVKYDKVMTELDNQTTALYLSVNIMRAEK